jgi:hypothetical protein
MKLVIYITKWQSQPPFAGLLQNCNSALLQHATPVIKQISGEDLNETGSAWLN